MIFPVLELGSPLVPRGAEREVGERNVEAGAETRWVWGRESGYWRVADWITNYH